MTNNQQFPFVWCYLDFGLTGAGREEMIKEGGIVPKQWWSPAPASLII
jgi:hypothetical protein